MRDSVFNAFPGKKRDYTDVESFVQSVPAVFILEKDWFSDIILEVSSRNAVTIRKMEAKF